MNNKMNLVFGTMNIGPQITAEESQIMIQHFLQTGNRELDTAYVYNDGDTEKILGTILPTFDKGITSIATKVHPRISGRLDADAVQFQFSESLKRMNLSKVDILYFHFPEQFTPIESALEECNKLYEQGKIKELGLSNFPAWKVVETWYICEKNNWLRPTVYQGMYNGLCRNVEQELFPAIRKLDMRFYSFNPLAGGLLTGKHHQFEKEPLAGRFSRLKSYKNRYWKKSYFDAINILLSECEKHGIKIVEAAFRWLSCHSFLNREKGDGIIIGASSLTQLEQNLLSLNKGVLPKDILSAFDIAWDEVKSSSPDYFQFFPK